MMAKFPVEIQNFANVFVTLQTKRHDADYDPYITLYKSSVQTDIGAAKAVIKAFSNAPWKDRRAFAAWVLLKSRKF